MNKPEKQVAESWKEAAEKEKKILGGHTADQPKEGLYVPNEFTKKAEEASSQEAECRDESCECHDHEHKESAGDSMEVDFLNYITSLGFQALICLGEIAHPLTNKTEQNLNQAKFLIDTLAMMKDKTKGNLTKQGEGLLQNSIYELQLKYVDKTQGQPSKG